MQKLSSPCAPTPHLDRVDVLRGIAFIAVFLYHLTIFPLPGFAVSWHNGLRDYSAVSAPWYPLIVVSWGWLGVALFFVISGFCIHLGFLRREECFSARWFFARRFLRIYPAYLVNLVAILALMPLLPTRYFGFWQVPMHLFMLHNLNKSTFVGLNPIYWSLAVECQFYLLYPLLLRLRQRMTLSGCLCLSLGLNLLCQIYFTRVSPSTSPVNVDWSFPLVTWCDWILGACLAESYVAGKRLFPRPVPIFLITLFMVLASVHVKILWVQSYLFGAAFFAVVMDIYLARRTAMNALERLLVPVGLISYSLYLWHQPVIILTEKIGASLHLANSAATLFFIYLPVTSVALALICTASYWWIELGVPRWLIQWARSHRASSSETIAVGEKGFEEGPRPAR